MLEPQQLPALNATLNSISAMLLAFGFYFIKQKQIARHKLCMTLALVTSAMFLASYLVYHFQVGSVPFTKEGPIRYVYFTILITHIILAIAILPMIIMTFLRAWKNDFKRHRAIAKWTWPLWMYVSVTGVIVYVMLYEM